MVPKLTEQAEEFLLYADLRRLLTRSRLFRMGLQILVVQLGAKIAWVRVYQVPQFVFFNHGNHRKAGIECVTCHGPVADREVLAQEISAGLVGCMNCHAARKVSTECHFCHALGY